MTDMDVAADRLADAVRGGETVAVFGDYDVDGACSAALMVGFLRSLGCTVLHHVPDRIKEGYGPNAPALRAIWLRRGVSADRVRRLRHRRRRCARRRGSAPADVVVLDHHKSEGPAAHRCWRRSTPTGSTMPVGPGDAMCAAGVAFLTADRDAARAAAAGVCSPFARRAGPDAICWISWRSRPCATSCRCVGFNRALVCQGLKVMARRARPGLWSALMDVALARDRPRTRSTCGYRAGSSDQCRRAHRRG